MITVNNIDKYNYFSFASHRKRVPMDVASNEVSNMA
jgi:hypothetical protein